MLSLIIYDSVIFSILLLFIDKIKPRLGVYRLLIPIIFSYIVFVSSIRYHVGSDFLSYVKLYYSIEYNNNFSLSYTTLNIILRQFIESPQAIFLVTSIIVYGFIFLTYKNYKSLSIILLWFILFYFLSLNLLRQGIALAILTYSIYYIPNKKKYYALIILAFSFHSTGIIGLIFPILYNFRIKNIRLILLLSPLFIIIDTPSILNYLGIFKGSYYEFYITDSNIYAGSQSLSIGGMFRLIIPIAFIFIFNKTKDNNINLIKNSMLIYIILYFLSINFYILYRIYALFSILIPIACFFILKKKKKYKILVYLYIIGCFFIFQKSISEQTIYPAVGNSIYPYQTIFDKQIIYTKDK